MIPHAPANGIHRILGAVNAEWGPLLTGRRRFSIRDGRNGRLPNCNAAGLSLGKPPFLCATN
jgi:hypothetical protein